MGGSQQWEDGAPYFSITPTQLFESRVSFQIIELKAVKSPRGQTRVAGRIEILLESGAPHFGQGVERIQPARLR